MCKVYSTRMTVKTVFASIEDLAKKIGVEVATSDWLLISQNRIDQFANATNDRQWIHVDALRAKSEAPGGHTIAHGYLTLSLIAGFADEAFIIENVGHVINYGLEKVRFISPVPVNSRVKAHFVVQECKPVKDNVRKITWQITWQVTIELEGSSKPACVAEIIFRYHINS